MLQRLSASLVKYKDTTLFSFLNKLFSIGTTSVEDITALRNTEPTTVGARVYLERHHVGCDRYSGGWFMFDDADNTSADNGGTIVVTAGGARWKREYSGFVDIRWFGCIGDNATDNTAYLQAAVTWACKEGNKATLWIPEGTFLVKDNIDTPGRYLFNMKGAGGLRDTSASLIKFAQNKSLLLRGIVPQSGTNGTYTQAAFEDVIFSGSNKNTDSPVKLIDVIGLQFNRCTFAMCAYGANLLNEASYTESCVFRNCYFPVSCKTAILYRRTGGSDSFYGSGLDNCFLEDSGTGAPHIEIGAGCKPYNAPLNVTIGHTPDGSHPIIQHNGEAFAWFVGNIRAEVGEEHDCQLVGGKDLHIIGSFTCMGSRVLTDQAIFCDALHQAVGGQAIALRRKPFTKQVKFTSTGGGKVWEYKPAGSPLTFKIYLTVAAPSYAYEAEYTMHTNYSDGSKGSVVLDREFRFYDKGSLGKPSVEYNSSTDLAQLFVWRTGLPEGAVVHLDIHPMSTSLSYPLR